MYAYIKLFTLNFDKKYDYLTFIQKTRFEKLKLLFDVF